VSLSSFSGGYVAPPGLLDRMRALEAPATFYRETIPRGWAGWTGVGPLTSGQLYAVALPLLAGDVVTNLSFRSGGTAAVTPTNWWFALYSSAATPALLATTADQTTTAWGTNTTKTVALTAPQTIAADGVYYAAIMMAAATVVNLLGITLSNNMGQNDIPLTGFKMTAETVGAGLTVPGGAPANLSGATYAAARVWAAAT